MGQFNSLDTLENLNWILLDISKGGKTEQIANIFVWEFIKSNKTG